MNKMTELVRRFVQNIGENYGSYGEMERAERLAPEVTAYFDLLFEEMAEQAKESYLRIVDVYNGWEDKEQEDWLSCCTLPESVVEFMKVSGCDFDFLASLFAIVESQNEVAGFQLAEGDLVCRWISEYRTLTADYDYFKEAVEGELTELANSVKLMKREFLYDYHLYVCGNRIGQAFLERFLNELEEEYSQIEVAKLARLYKKAKEEEKAQEERGKKQRVSFAELYLKYRRELMVDILKYAKETGSCCVDEGNPGCSQLPENLKRFMELSECTTEELFQLFALAADKISEDEEEGLTYMETLEEGKRVCRISSLVSAE